MDLKTLLADTKARFRAHHLPTPDIDARFLIQDILELSSTDLLLSEKALTTEQLEQVEAAINRRMQGEPVSRILGYRDFWGRRFYLSHGTLDPRPDTETLIQAVLESQTNPYPRILDLGTGTGAILLTLLHEIPDSTGMGIDLSEDACRTAQWNAHEHGLESRVEILCGSWLEPVTGLFDIIVSNPPYIPTAEIATLSHEVQNHDPILALDGGEDGLVPYKFLLSTLKKFLVPGGLVFFEVGRGQAADLTKIASDSDATLSRTYRDLGGVERVVKITYGDK